MIKNIKLPVTFRRESSILILYHFFQNTWNEMFWLDLLSESCKEGISLLGNEDGPIFPGYVIISRSVWIFGYLFTSYLS